MKTLWGFIIGFVVCGICFFLIASEVYYSNTPRSCMSCHEMRVFYNTWKLSAHGLAEKGAVRAKCVDCHLPHTSLSGYLLAKARAGLHDYLAHFSGKMNTPEKWLDYVKQREMRETVKPIAFDSGCRQCHKVLIGNGIPLKAIKAHKAYLLGETKKTCVSCHRSVGHGDIVSTFTELTRKQNKGG